jgi:hypothetical protein
MAEFFLSTVTSVEPDGDLTLCFCLILSRNDFQLYNILESIIRCTVNEFIIITIFSSLKNVPTQYSRNLLNTSLQVAVQQVFRYAAARLGDSAGNLTQTKRPV